MAGLSFYNILMASLASNAERAAENVAKVTPVPLGVRGGGAASPATREPLPSEEKPADATSLHLLRSTATDATKAVEKTTDAAGAITDAAKEIVDLLTALRDGQAIETLVPHQRAVLEQLRQTSFNGIDFGKYVDRFAQLYIEKLSSGFGIDPVHRQKIDETLAQAVSLIKTWGGKAGAALNIHQLEADLKALYQTQQNVKKLTKTMSKVTGSESGTLGSKTPTTCNPQTSLSMMLYSGDLR